MEICYDSFGSSSDRPLLLIMGLATPMIAWPEAFCRKLAEAGHWVVRFDNRDIGLSTKMEHLGLPDLNQLMTQADQGGPVVAPYTLADMACDTVGLLDDLGIGRAHVCGLSMGGMIAQTAVVNHPERFLSLISMMSSTGEPCLPPSTPEVRQVMMAAPPPDRQGYVRYIVEQGRAFAGDSKFFDERMQSDLGARMFDRGIYPWGFVRQMAAILASGGRRKSLGAIKIPALVIHGSGDPALPLAHGRDTAAAIPGAELLILDGLGHGMTYPGLWDTLVRTISRFTAAAGEKAGRRLDL